ncbi:MAG: flagellar hook-basal body complex protein FliE [bacterium]
MLQLIEWEWDPLEPTFDLTSLTPLSSQPDISARNGSKVSGSPTAEIANSFADSLAGKLNQVENTQRDAQQKMRLFAAGKIDNVHDVTIAMQKANMAMRTATLVREKILGGFDQLKKMQ